MSSPAVPRSGEARVVLYTRAGCHLCEDAETLAGQVVAETGDDLALVDVDSDPALRELFTAHVPVTYVDGEQLSYWVLDEARLRGALARR